MKSPGDQHIFFKNFITAETLLARTERDRERMGGRMALWAEHWAAEDPSDPLKPNGVFPAGFWWLLYSFQHFPFGMGLPILRRSYQSILEAGNLFSRFTHASSCSRLCGPVGGEINGGKKPCRTRDRQGYHINGMRRSREVTGALPAVTEFSGPVGTESCFR